MDKPLPKEGTHARRTVDYWRSCPVECQPTFNMLLHVYCSKRTWDMRKDEKSRAGMTLTKLLKKYGHKLGPAGSRAPWRFGQKPVTFSKELIDQISMPKKPKQPMQNGRKVFRTGDVVRYPDGQLATVDGRLLDTLPGAWWGPLNGDSGYWPITWHDPADKPNYCCGSEGKCLELVEAAPTSPFFDQIFTLQQEMYNTQMKLVVLKQNEAQLQKVHKIFSSLSDHEKSEMTELCYHWERGEN